MINEKEVFRPVLEIIDFNYPTQKEKERVYRGKLGKMSTIFFERVFFKTLSHICQECLVNSDSASFSTGLPNKIYITKYVPELVVKEKHWETIVKETGFDIVETRNAWAKVVLEFTKHKLDLAEKITLPEDIQFSTIQTIFLILFCYFYFFNKEYITLSSQNDSFVLPEKKHITWALFEPGVISQFIAPLRKLCVFRQFDERDLAQLFKLSGNSLTSLRWILRPVYEEWFQPLQSYIQSLDKTTILSDERFSSSAISTGQNSDTTENNLVSSPEKASFILLPQVDTENHGKTGEKSIPDEQEQKDWEQMYYEKVREVQGLRQQLIEKKDHVSNDELLAVLEELLRTSGDFEELFLKILPRRGPKTNRKWRTLERTMLNLRSLFVQSGFVTFGRINETVSMEAVDWPYAIDNRASIANTEITYDKWRVTRRGVKKNDIIILPVLVEPL